MLACVPAWAADEEVGSSKSTTQKVGGLLFEMDEGVKVEQGPGGSVYVKSNKEYMQQKFKEIDSQLEDLNERVAKLEKVSEAKAAEEIQAQEEKKVLVT